MYVHDFRDCLGPLHSFHGVQLLRKREVNILRALVELRKNTRDPLTAKGLGNNYHYPLKNLATLNMVEIAGKFPAEIHFDFNSAQELLSKLDRVCSFGVGEQQLIERHFIRVITLADKFEEYEITALARLAVQEIDMTSAVFYKLMTDFEGMYTRTRFRKDGGRARHYIVPGNSIRRVIDIYQGLAKLTQRSLQTSSSKSASNFYAAAT